MGCLEIFTAHIWYLCVIRISVIIHVRYCMAYEIRLDGASKLQNSFELAKDSDRHTHTRTVDSLVAFFPRNILKSLRLYFVRGVVIVLYHSRYWIDIKKIRILMRQRERERNRNCVDTVDILVKCWWKYWMVMVIIKSLAMHINMQKSWVNHMPLSPPMLPMKIRIDAANNERICVMLKAGDMRKAKRNLKIFSNGF